jgi:hypothetical protein
MSEWENVGPMDAEKKLKALLHEIDVVGREWIEIQKNTTVGPNRKLREVEFVMKAETPKRVLQKMERLAKIIHGLKLPEAPKIKLSLGR